ncbi:uncharacterized protein DFL_003721 [Arthrobotrys flagrans]|uniref:Uncharacterized protein n=1 Tax=Arthrobotrys flagrans TaxID=97331 RepID=A0A437A2T0_ARTFL|nr:hypothetical protein DFL_003721 [Arthrobotrys flagrans]
MADDRAVQPEIEVGLKTQGDKGLRRNTDRTQQRAQQIAEARRIDQLRPPPDETHNQSDQGGASETLASAGARAATVPAMPTRATAGPAEIVAPPTEVANSRSNRQPAEEQPTATATTNNPPISRNRGGPVVPTVRHDLQNRRRHPPITPASNIGGTHTTSDVSTTSRVSRLSGTLNTPTATLQANSDEIARQLSNIRSMMTELFTRSNNAQQTPINGQRGWLPRSRSTAERIERNSEQRRGTSNPNYTSERAEPNNDNSGGQEGHPALGLRLGGPTGTTVITGGEGIDQNSRQQEGTSISSSEVERTVQDNDNNGHQEGADDSGPAVEVTD